MSEEELEQFLTQEEEWALVYHFSIKMAELCAKFQPPMPRYVRGTSCHYFKRFYLHNSVMDHHPKDILVTAVYLACKTEEFNVSMQQFVANINGNQVSLVLVLSLVVVLVLVLVLVPVLVLVLILVT